MPTPPSGSQDHDTQRLSLRRELDARLGSLCAHIHDPTADLSGLSRADLENEVRHLREELLLHDHELREHISAYRDVVSGAVSGKDDTYLQLNQSDMEPTARRATVSEIFQQAGRRALGGGLPGAAAMGLQIGTLMWLRTTINYQYRHGTTTTAALKHLYAEGGVPRFYRGVLPALLQGPLSRFGDTAANAFVLSMFSQVDSLKDLPIAVKSLTASAAAASWRVFLMPIDTTKTIMQVEGTKGITMLRAKVSAGGSRVLYAGALGASAATFAGHAPWFLVYNSMNQWLPDVSANELALKLGRSALMGFCASLTADTISNSLRVIKVTKQTSAEVISYRRAAEMVVAKDGVRGLFFRGLKTKILANGVQGVMFSVLWRVLEDAMKAKVPE